MKINENLSIGYQKKQTRIKISFRWPYKKNLLLFYQISIYWKVADSKIDELLPNILKREQKILKYNIGEIRKTIQCFVCKSKYHEYTYSGINHYDIQHGIISEYTIIVMIIGE
jgi:hypothetical protein